MNIDEIIDKMRKENSDEDIIKFLFIFHCDGIIDFDSLSKLYFSLGYIFNEEFLKLDSLGRRDYVFEIIDGEWDVNISKMVRMVEHSSNISILEDFIPSDKVSLSSEPKRRKYNTYLRNMINVGDYYFARFERELMIVKVIKKGDQYHPNFTFQIIGLEEFLKTFVQKEINYNEMPLLGFVNKESKLEKRYQKYKLMLNKKYEVMNMFDDPSVILSSLIKSDLNIDKNKIELYPEFGLFKYSIYKDKLLTIPGIINSRDALIGKQEISLFENYFYIKTDMVNFHKEYPHLNEYNHKHILFRKINNPHKLIDEIKVLDNQLLVDAIDLKCALAEPYKLYRDSNRVIVNSKGNEYKFIDLFKFISPVLTCADRTTSKATIISLFSDYCQNGSLIKFKGFTSKEIIAFVEENFVFDVSRGYYYSHDSHFEVDGDIIAYDKKWFEILYQYIKKNPKKNIHKCSDIIPNKRLEEFFNFYLIEQNDLMEIVCIVKESGSFVEFLERIEIYLIKKYGLKLNKGLTIYNFKELSEEEINTVVCEILTSRILANEFDYFKAYRKVDNFNTLLIFGDSNNSKNEMYVLLEHASLKYNIFTKEEFLNKYNILFNYDSVFKSEQWRNLLLKSGSIPIRYDDIKSWDSSEKENSILSIKQCIDIVEKKVDCRRFLLVSFLNFYEIKELIDEDQSEFELLFEFFDGKKELYVSINRKTRKIEFDDTISSKYEDAFRKVLYY